MHIFCDKKTIFVTECGCLEKIKMRIIFVFFKKKRTLFGGTVNGFFRKTLEKRTVEKELYSGGTVHFSYFLCMFLFPNMYIHD